MRRVLSLMCAAVLSAVMGRADVISTVDGFAGSISYEVTNIASDSFRYTYYLSGFSLNANQEVAIHFAPDHNGALSDGVAGSDFDLILLQTNNPDGTDGVYSALALVDNPSLAGPFGVTFVFNGPGMPGSQQFDINEFTASGAYIRTLAAGLTTPYSTEPAVTPEPASVGLAAAGLILCAAAALRRRRQ